MGPHKDTTQKNADISMPGVGFEHTILMFELSKTYVS
jgi:hypothetical protein